MKTLKKHAGSCHCGRVRFEILASIDHARVCDCSICRRRGALIFRVPAEHFSLLSPWEELSEYRWGTHTGCDYFCPVCGILPFRRPSAPSPEEVAAGILRRLGRESALYRRAGPRNPAHRPHRGLQDPDSRLTGLSDRREPPLAPEAIPLESPRLNLDQAL